MRWPRGGGIMFGTAGKDDSPFGRRDAGQRRRLRGVRRPRRPVRSGPRRPAPRSSGVWSTRTTAPAASRCVTPRATCGASAPTGASEGRRLTSGPWSVEHLIADLRRLGVAAGDLLMVHASLRAIGHVDGGADRVIDALEAAVGPDGTLLIDPRRPRRLGLGQRTTGASSDRACWRRRAVRPPGHASRSRHRASWPRCSGPGRGTVVSDHPEGRFAASGTLAEQPARRRSVGRLLRARLAARTVRRGGWPGAPPRRRPRHGDPAPLRRVPGAGPVKATGPPAPARERSCRPRDARRRVPRRQRRHRRLPRRGLLRRHPPRVPRDRQGVDRAASAAPRASSSTRPTSWSSPWSGWPNTSSPARRRPGSARRHGGHRRSGSPGRGTGPGHPGRRPGRAPSTPDPPPGTGPGGGGGRLRHPRTPLHIASDWPGHFPKAPRPWRCWLRPVPT